MSIAITHNKAPLADIIRHLKTCSSSFIPPLGDRVDIESYAVKLHERAERFEAWTNVDLVGLVAIYIDCATAVAFVTNVSVDPALRRTGVASSLMMQAIDFAANAGCTIMELSVNEQNESAVASYNRLGFRRTRRQGLTISMQRSLGTSA